MLSKTGSGQVQGILNFSHVIGQDGRKLYYLPLGVLPQPASTGQIPGLGFQKLWMSPFSVRKNASDVILIKTMRTILPRHARDKHRESTPKKGCVFRRGFCAARGR
jgi:hypothetical protein